MKIPVRDHEQKAFISTKLISILKGFPMLGSLKNGRDGRPMEQIRGRKKKGQGGRPFQALYPFATGKRDSLRAYKKLSN